MTSPPVRRGPAGCQLRVDGHLDDHWSAWFGGLTLTRESDGTTRLRGLVADQTALHGLLTKVRDLGLTLISVEVSDPSHGAFPETATIAATTGEFQRSSGQAWELGQP